MHPFNYTNSLMQQIMNIHKCLLFIWNLIY